MKLIYMLLAAASYVVMGSDSAMFSSEDVRSMYKEWMMKHNRRYESVEEEDERFGIFAKNLEYILEHNVRHTLGETSFSMAMNQHMDLTFDEFKATKLNYKGFTGDHSVSFGYAGTHYAPLIRGIEAAPTTLDWRTKGAITPVKDQGQCGSCWAFSATGSIEAAHFLATGKLVSLSEEQLINCVMGGSYDCDNGGEMVDAFKYVISNHGITSEASDPYTLKDHQTCKYKSNGAYAATISSYKTVAVNNENALLSAVAITPVSIAIDASHNSFQFYSSGVYNDAACCRDCTSYDLDHGVLLVGYGTENGKDYWLVKNSWGSSWGQAGYIKIIRNDRGACGVPTEASYPIV